MKFWLKISFFFVLFYIGNPLRNYFNKKIILNSEGTNFNKIKRALEDSTEISIWGNSTSFMSFDAYEIEKTLNKSCYNYGIEGVYYNELIHMKIFNLINSGKHIIWVINPFEFLPNQESQINITKLYLPFSGFIRIEDQLKSFDFKIIHDFGWSNIFNYNAEHWKLILDGKSKVKFNDYGNIEFQQKFKSKNEFYKNPYAFSFSKIENLNLLIKTISENNKLTLVIPPNLSAQNFKPFLRLINHPVIDYSNFFKSKSSFQDHIHINPNEMKSLTKKLCDDLKQKKN